MEPLLRRNLFRSLIVAFAASACLYALGLGLALTHEEVAISTHAIFLVAVWTWPVVFLLSLAFLIGRDAGKSHL